jgi:hypothetical protein
MVRLCQLLDLAKQASMKIAILSAGEVSGMYAVTLIQRGHEVMFGPFGHAPTAVAQMLKEGIDGALILTDDDENFREIAELFIRETVT